MTMRLLRTPFVLMSTVVLASACSDGTGPEVPVEVTLSFVATSPEGAALALSAPIGASTGMVEATGSNGVLTLDDLQIVVDEFKLEREEGACDLEAAEECATFELPPYFLDLPLDAVPIDIASAPVTDGTYATLKLETKDLASSAGDPDAEMETLADQVRADFPDWPESASLRVAGTFAPQDGGDPRPFVVYFHAEVKVELSFEPPMSIAAEEETTGVLVEVDPLAWFTLEDGSVSDLSQFDFETTGDVVDFEAKMAEGFTKVEIAG